METNDQISLIKKSVEGIDYLLGMSTGLEPVPRKTVAYYTLATRSLPTANTCPLLVCRGPMGTGKSECSRIVKVFALRNWTKPRVDRAYIPPLMR
jgi:hypothetical protein